MSGMELRPYQLEAIARVRLAMQQGRRRVVLVLPTGAGKTVITSEIARLTVAQNRRVLFLAHRTELVDQAAATLARFGLNVGARCASAQTPPNPFAPVQVASVQTLLSRGDRPPADVIIADEAHHFASASVEWSALLAAYPDAHIIGPTATPERGDGCGLGTMFDGLVVGATVRELTDAGHLVPCEIMRPDKYLQPGEIAQNPVDAYVSHASDRRAIVFARSVQLADEYAQEFRLRGVEARALSNETPWGERQLYLGAFRDGQIRVLVNVYVLTEGFDDPGVSCCILARGCGSAGAYLQMVGRILRPDAGKTSALLLDLRGVSHEHGKPEDEREYSLNGKGIRLKDPNCYCPVCGCARTPGEGCAECGWVPAGEDTAKADRVTGDRLRPYHKLRETDDDQKRIVRLSRWLAEAQARSFKVGWAKHKFHVVYGAWPTTAQMLAARALVAPESPPPSPEPVPAPAQVDVREWLASRPHTPECRCKQCREVANA